MSILLRIAYDGTRFSGWARQNDRADGRPVRTVQGEIEAALGRLYGRPIRIKGASRTDAGVHALGQLAAYDDPGTIPPHGVLAALAGRLPPDVTVFAAWSEPGHADVRGANDGKRYRYRIRTTRARDPVGGRDEWHVGRRLDVAAMHDAGASFVGRHDFAGFRSAGCQARTTARTVTAVAVTGRAAPLGPASDRGRFDPVDEPSAADLVEIVVDGQAFLQNMVRIMVGTLVEIGRRKRHPGSIGEVLGSGDRRAAGPTAPAGGLTLVAVNWP